MSFAVQTVGFSSLINGIDDLIDIGLDDDTIYFVGSNVEYSIYVEFGTSKMEAQPYLRKAARAVQRSVPRIASQTNPESVAELVKIVALELESLAARFAPVDTGNLQASIKAVPA